jgi:Fur family transcriptional regulator, zinc uptake regulator
MARSDGSGDRVASGDRHDHAACIADAIAYAERMCRERGERFTPMRRRVLELIWHDHRPVKAYELIDALAREGVSVKPPTVYRALDFLLGHGLVHRLDTLNAFIGCPDPASRHEALFLICESCGAVGELRRSSVFRQIEAEAGRLGFDTARLTVELSGRCAVCRNGAAAGAAEP